MRQELNSIQLVSNPIDLVDKLESWLDDARTAKAACDKIITACKSRKEGAKNKKKLLSSSRRAAEPRTIR